MNIDREKIRNLVLGGIIGFGGLRACNSPLTPPESATDTPANIVDVDAAIKAGVQETVDSWTQTPIATASITNTVEIDDVVTKTSTPEPTQTVTEAPTSAVETESFPYDLFNKGNNFGFVVNSEGVGSGWYRILEFNYGLKIAGNKLVEYKPIDKGVDPNAWPARVALFDVSTNRKIEKAGEVEARHPIELTIAPVDKDIVTEIFVTLDNHGNNPDFEKAYKTTSVKGVETGIFIGSEFGSDVSVETFNENGDSMGKAETYYVAGTYCDDCVPGTNMLPKIQQYAENPNNFSFKDGTRKDVLTKDILAINMPKDFKGYWKIKIAVDAGKTAKLWLGELNPLKETATPTVTPTASK